LVVKAFSRGVVIGSQESEEAFVGEGCEIGLSGEDASQSADGVFDAALLPGGVGIAEEGLGGEVVQPIVSGEFGAIVEGDGLAQIRRQCREEGKKLLGDGVGFFAVRSRCNDQPAVTIVNGEDGLAVFGKENEIGFPMSGGLAIGGRSRALSDGNPGFDEACRTAAAAASEAAFALAPGQKEAPAEVVGAIDLSVDEAIDAFVADDRMPSLALEATGDLLRRPALLQTVEDSSAQVCVVRQSSARPAPSLCLFGSVGRSVSDRRAAVSPQLARDRRWRAIQSCRDFPDREPGGLKSGNLFPVCQ